MAGCPYTWFKSLISKNENSKLASLLRVSVQKNKETVVDVSLPANSARWLIDLIPGDVVFKIKSEGIPLDAIQLDLASRSELLPQKIFILDEPNRTVSVWLE